MNEECFAPRKIFTPEVLWTMAVFTDKTRVLSECNEHFGARDSLDERESPVGVSLPRVTPALPRNLLGPEKGNKCPRTCLKAFSL